MPALTAHQREARPQTIVTAKILLPSTRRAWAQVFEHQGFVAVLGIGERSEGEGKAAAELGQEVRALFEQQYSMMLPEHTPQKALEIVETVYARFEKDQLAVAACFFTGDTVYFVRRGACQIWAIRQGKPYRLNSENFSGQFTSTDLFVLGTDEFFRIVGDQLLETTFEEKSTVDYIVEPLRPVVQIADNPKAAAVVIKAKRDVVSDIAVPNPASPPLSYKEGLIRRLLVRFARMLPEREFQVNIPGRSPRATALSVGIVLLLLLSVSIFFGVRQKGNNDYKALYQDRLSRAQVLYSDAISQKSTNLLQARESFIQSKSIATALEEEGVQDIELDELKNNLDQQEADILGQSHVPASLFLDLSIFRSDSQTTEISFSKGVVAALDKKGERVIFVGRSKDTSVSGKVVRPESVSIFEGKTYVLGQEGIAQTDKTSTKTLIISDSEWVNPIKIAAFGPNLYLLQKDGVIWKYPAAGSAFGIKQKWLVGDAPGPVVDWAFDGSVYALTENGDIAKFTRGLKDGFRISSLTKAFNRPVAVYTDSELDSVYVLDRENSRIVELDKKGEYKFEYLVDEAKIGEDIAVSYQDKKIFLLSQNKIFEIPLK